MEETENIVSIDLENNHTAEETVKEESKETINVTEEGKVEEEVITEEGKVEEEVITEEGKVEEEVITEEGKVEEEVITEEGKVEEEVITEEGKVEEEVITEEGKVEEEVVTEGMPVDYKFKVVITDSKINVYDSTGKIVFNSTDASKAIQYALDHLTSGRTVKEKVLVVGDFTAPNTIKFPSLVIFELQGSIKLADHKDKWLVTDKTGGVSNIEMIGGKYDGNKANQSLTATSDHVIRFSKVTKSHFKDMTIQNAVNDNFTLDTGCNNNLCENLVGSSAGTGRSSSNDGNGLVDKGDNNTWINCRAEDNFSDSWVIKCDNSIFRGCVGKGSKNAVGFGFFTDSSHLTANGNRFEKCEAYNNQHSGFSFSNSQPGGQINNNFIQGEFYNNGVGYKNSTGNGSGVRLRINGGKTITGNQFDVYCHDNPETGFLIQTSGIQKNTGSIVALDNKLYDIDIQKGTGNSFDVYIPVGKNTKIRQGTNKINKIAFDCNNVPVPFCTQRYCGV